jgi:hypothetical protein
MSSKKYIPTVDPLFAVILQAYKKVKVGKKIMDVAFECYHRSKMNPGSTLKWTHLSTTEIVPNKAKTFTIYFSNAPNIGWLEHLKNRWLPRGNLNRTSLDGSNFRRWVGPFLIGGGTPADAIKGLALHNVHEYANYTVMLPKIYKELEGKIFED